MECKIEHKVVVKCFTYNHSKYIEEALNGFCIQETNFPFVCTIMDDASTDGEPEVIKKYLQEHFDLDNKSIVCNEETDDYVMSFAQHKRNKNCYFAVYYLKYNHYSIKKSKRPYIEEWKDQVKYIAICEGDDYWIDPMKLQKQVDILETKPDVGLVYTNHYNRKGDKIELFKEKGYTQFEQLIISSGIGTLTSCYRADLYKRYLEDIQPYNKGWKMGDSPLWKYISFHSRIKFLPDYTAVYRVLETSASHFTSSEKRIAFINSGYEIQLFFINKYIGDAEKQQFFLSEAKKRNIINKFNTFISYYEFDRAKALLKAKKRDLKISERIRLYYKLLYFFSSYKVYNTNHKN